MSVVVTIFRERTKDLNRLLNVYLTYYCIFFFIFILQALQVLFCTGMRVLWRERIQNDHDFKTSIMMMVLQSNTLYHEVGRFLHFAWAFDVERCASL